MTHGVKINEQQYSVGHLIVVTYEQKGRLMYKIIDKNKVLGAFSASSEAKRESDIIAIVKSRLAATAFKVK